MIWAQCAWGTCSGLVPQQPLHPSKSFLEQCDSGSQCQGRWTAALTAFTPPSGLFGAVIWNCNATLRHHDHSW
eukprot:1148275-Pelagomonas_calceolata.AAC.1